MRDAAVRAERYLRSRQSPAGGFCFYRWEGVEEPSLADTWHAMASFALLGVEVPRHDDVVAFVQGFAINGFDDQYHHALALDLLGQEIQQDQHLLSCVTALDAVTALMDERVPLTGRLERALRVAQLQQRFGAIDAPEILATRVDALWHDGGWGDKPNLGDTWLALAILDICNVRAFTDATRRFVDALQVVSFGFTATCDSMYANLDTVYAGIRACAALELHCGIPTMRSATCWPARPMKADSRAPPTRCRTSH